MHEHDEEEIVMQHANELLMIKTMVFEKANDRYVFPSQCEQVFYSKVPSKRDWSFVVRYDPIGRPVKYIVVEEDDDVELEKEEYGSTDEEDREDEQGVGDNAPILDDDIDEDMLENDIGDDDDIINPFNIVSGLDVDIDVGLDDQEEAIEEG
jgi:hypothetical protein